MWLGHYLWYQCCIIKVFDIKDLPLYPIVIRSCLVYVGKQVFILKVEFVKFLVIVLIFIIWRWMRQIFLILSVQILLREICLKINPRMHKEQVLVSIVCPMWMLSSLILITPLFSFLLHLCFFFNICLIFYVIYLITIIFLIIII